MAFNRRKLEPPAALVVDKGAAGYFEKLQRDMLALVPVAGRVEWDDDLAVPEGFLRCDGSLQLRRSYANLYAIVGDKYGANDGATNFKLPTATNRIVKY